MQWVKYLFFALFILGVGWSAWLIYTSQFAQLSVTVVLLLIFVGVFGFVWYPTIKQHALMTRLQKDGVQTQAQILDVQNTSQYVNELPILRVKVKYFDNQKNEIVGEIAQPIPFQSLSMVSPSKVIRILVDPKNTEVFVLDL